MFRLNRNITVLENRRDSCETLSDARRRKAAIKEMWTLRMSKENGTVRMREGMAAIILEETEMNA